MSGPHGAWLDAARGLGDKLVDDVAEAVISATAAGAETPVTAYLKAVQTVGLVGLTFRKKDWLKLITENKFVEESAKELAPLFNRPPEAVAEQMDAAERLFGRYGQEISGALLLAALPQAFAAENGARVLIGRGLTTDVRRRIRGTAQFLMLALTGLPTLRPDGTKEPAGFDRWEASSRAAIGLRLLHAAVRSSTPNQRMERWDGKPPADVPINQEDLMGTLLSFTVSVFEVLDRFGVKWSDSEQQDYLMAWDHLGEVLGILERPKTVVGAQSLLAEIRTHQWIALKDLSFGNREKCTEAGRELIHVLLADLSGAMPRGSKSLPATLVRELAPSLVRERLGLGGGGLAELAIDSIPHVSSGARGLLHHTANYVTRCSITHFVRDPTGPPFTIPGLEDWIEGLRVTK